MNSLLLAVALVGQVEFEQVNPGITPQIQAWKDANPTGWWSWSVRSNVDFNGDGKLDLHFGTHSAQGGAIFLQGEDHLDWDDATTALGLTHAIVPNESAPLFADLDKNGWVDIVAIGDENDHVNLMNYGGTSFSPSAGHARPMTSGVVWDNDADGWLDVIRTDHRSFGKLSTQVARNNYGVLPPSDVMTFTQTQQAIPADLPLAIQGELATLASDTSTPNRYSGPLYWRGDLNNDGRQDCIVQYGGSYGDAAHRFGRYMIRDASGTLQDITSTCGLPPGCLPIYPPADVNDDGKADIVCAYGSSSLAGLYVQNADGTFSRQHDGKSMGTTLSPTSLLYSGPGYIHKIQWLDLDGDVDLDLFVSMPRGGTCGVYENRDGVMVRVLQATHANGDGAEWADINGDGKYDLITFGTTTLANVDVKFFINTSEGGEGPPPPPPPPPPIVTQVRIDGAPSTKKATVKVNGQVIGQPGDLIEVDVYEP